MFRLFGDFLKAISDPLGQVRQRMLDVDWSVSFGSVNGLFDEAFDTSPDIRE